MNIKDNICEIVIGRRTLKWDAAWRIIEWLTKPAAGHGLGDQFREKLVLHCLQLTPKNSEIAVEYYLGKDIEGKSRHPDIAVAAPSFASPEVVALIDDLGNVSPNSSRKISNLLSYDDLAATIFPNSKRNTVVITDTTDLDRFKKLREVFSTRNESSLIFLPFQEMGHWIENMSAKDNRLVQDFVEWTASL